MQRFNPLKAILGFKLLSIILCLPVITLFGCDGGGSAPLTSEIDSVSFSEPQVLARVEVPNYLEDLNLPVYADLEDADGTYYALVIAAKTELDRAGATYRVIDNCQAGAQYLIALSEVEDDHKEAAAVASILYDDGEHIIVRYRSELPEILADIGFDLKLMSSTTVNFTRAARVAAKETASKAARVTEKNAKVEAMLNAVTEANIKTSTEQLSGEQPVVVEGESYTIKSRHTMSGVPVQKATQYVYERLNGLGLAASFAEWNFDTINNRNVIGEIRGKTTPEEIVIMIAHLDTISNAADGIEPGADDNGSGCVALLTAAEIMRGYNFSRTIRFVFTTGEEQSLYGGTAYARKAQQEGQKIVAVLNLDMISYSKTTNPPVKPYQQIKIRNAKNQTGYLMDLPIAQTYMDVVKTYGMDQVFEAYIVDDGEVTSDQSPFWDTKIYAAAWIIEYAEKGFINPSMHSRDDRVAIINMPYYAAVVKAAIGTAAHLAVTTD